jgi:AhpD family alkylhydroperoxidase
VPAYDNTPIEINMTNRINVAQAGAGAFKMMAGLEAYVRNSGLERPLIELVKLRASYINGCAYCIDMHSKDARAAGETEQRLYAVPVWHETPFYTPRERAALAWTEAVTRIADDGVPDDVYNEATAQFTEKELADLTMAVVTINGWNRFSVAFRSEVGTYQPPAKS